MKITAAGPCLMLVIAVAPLAANARTAPIHDIENQPITSTSEVTMDDVEKAIVAAGRNRGWIMKRVEPGHLLATLNIRTHQAVVDITFDEKQYSIKYKSSENLDYEDGKIHPNYNSWIGYLDQDIQANLPL